MQAPKMPLPKSWSTTVRFAMLHVISLARFAAVHTTFKQISVFHPVGLAEANHKTDSAENR